MVGSGGRVSVACSILYSQSSYVQTEIENNLKAKGLRLITTVLGEVIKLLVTWAIVELGVR